MVKKYVGQRKNRRYSPESKLEAVRLSLEEGVPFKEIARRLDITSGTLVKVWVYKYNTVGASFVKEHRGGSLKKLREGETIEEKCHGLELENDCLKKLKALMEEGSRTHPAHLLPEPQEVRASTHRMGTAP